MTGGYLKLFRSIDQWEWYKDSYTKSLFFHCLIRSNHKPNNWRGIDVESGSFITSLDTLSYELGMSVHQIRIALKHLQKTNEIVIKTTNRFTQIFVVKWAYYQGSYDDDDKQMANKRQASDKQVATNKNDKNEKKDKNTNKEGNDVIVSHSNKSSYGEFTNVKLTIEEYEKIKSSRLESYIAKLSAYKESTGKKYKSDYATILNWSRKDGEGKRIEPIPTYESTSKPMTTEEIEALKKRLKGNGEPK